MGGKAPINIDIVFIGFFILQHTADQNNWNCKVFCCSNSYQTKKCAFVYKFVFNFTTRTIQNDHKIALSSTQRGAAQ